MAIPIQKRSREEVKEWILDFHRVADTLTTTELHRFYDEKSVLKFANNEPVVGINAINGFFNAVFPLLEKMKHTLTDFDVAGNKIYLTCTITYIVRGDPKKEELSFAAVGIFYLRDDGGVNKFEVYLDNSAVNARIGEVYGGKQG